MSTHDNSPQPQLTGSLTHSDEKLSEERDSVEAAYIKDEKSLGQDDDDVVLLNGEPVVTTGKDVSRFVVDLRDDGDAALTFRSLVLGTLFAGLGAALRQVRSICCSYLMVQR